jgi:hypothetical protein
LSIEGEINTLRGNFVCEVWKLGLSTFVEEIVGVRVLTFSHLRAIIFDKNIVHKWSKCLPFIQRIINSTVESSIGTTPASLLFGNEINLDRGVLLPFSEEEGGGSLSSRTYCEL